MEVMDAGRMAFFSIPRAASSAPGSRAAQGHRAGRRAGQPQLERAPDARRGGRQGVRPRSFGWDPQDHASAGREYTIFNVGENGVAGMMAMPPGVPDEVPAYWVAIFMVDDVDDALETIKAQGGSVMAGPMEMEGVGRFAVRERSAGRELRRHLDVADVTRMITRRRAKIVATLGPGDRRARGARRAASPPGMDCARLNCSHGDARRPAPARRATSARRGRARAAAPLGGAVRPPGAEAAARARDTRTRDVAAGDTRHVHRRRRRTRDDGASSSSSPGFARLVHRALGDRDRRRRAALRGRSASTRRRGRTRRALSPGPLAPRKGVNVTYARPELPAITEKDVADLALAAEIDADFVALLVRAQRRRHRADCATRLRELRLAARARSPRSRRSRPTSTSTRSSPCADGVMVARGDYGVEAGRRARAADAEGHDPPRDAARASSSSPPRRCSSR